MVSFDRISVRGSPIASDIRTSPVIAPFGILLTSVHDSRLYAFDIGAPGADIH